MVVLLLAGDKELKPVSFRVREAAEGLLTVIMEHLVCHPGINGVHCPKDGDCKNFHMSTGYPCWKHVEPRVGQCQFITQLSLDIPVFTSTEAL